MDKALRYTLIIVLSALFFGVGSPLFLLSDDTPAIVKAVSYHWFHANLWHLLANSLSIWLLLRTTRSRTAKTVSLQFIIAFLIASAMYFTATKPVVGISNILFAIVGLRTPAFRHPWWRKTETIVFFVVTFLLLLVPQFSSVTHITSLLSGIGIAALTRAIHSLSNDVTRAIGK